MIRTAYNKGFTDALQHFHMDVAKLAQFGAASMGGAARAGGTPSPAAAQPQMPPAMPAAAPGPGALPSAPSAPNARPTL
jgi:hypothetical protein